MEGPSHALSFAERSATLREKRVGGALAALGVLLTLGALPWASLPGAADPRVPLIADLAICIVDLCIALLLATSYRANGRHSLLVLTGVYVYGGLMAVLHLASFPGTLGPEPLLGGAQTVGWLYLAWRGLSAAGYLTAIIVETRGAQRAPASRRNTRLLLCALVAGAVCAAITLLAMQPSPIEAVAGMRFTQVNALLIWLAVALSAAALGIIYVRRAFDDALYVWVALALVAAAADLTLGNVAGARYTLGWSLARVGFVVSSYLLLAYALGGLPERRGASAAIATYGGAIGTALGAVLLRLVFDPWLGNDVPYITLFGAVALGVWLGGARAALLTFVLGYSIVRVLYRTDRTGRVDSGERYPPARTVRAVLWLDHRARRGDAPRARSASRLKPRCAIARFSYSERTGTRASSSQRRHTSCATRWRRCATESRSSSTSRQRRPSRARSR